jgi:hypothetical protein
MNNNMETKKLKLFEIVISLLLAITTAMSTWACWTITQHGESLSAHRIQIGTNTERLAILESAGSPGLKAHEREDDARELAAVERIAKLEQSMVAVNAGFAAVQRELGKIDAKLDNIETALRDLKERKP